jgi:DNA-binding GntR family transcriptional regulator
MLRRALDKLHHKGAIDHERNQQLTVRPELVEGLIQSFLK